MKYTKKKRLWENCEFLFFRSLRKKLIKELNYWNLIQIKIPKTIRIKSKILTKFSSNRSQSSDVDELIKIFKKEVTEIEVLNYQNGDRYEGQLNDQGQREGKGVYTTPR